MPATRLISITLLSMMFLSVFAMDVILPSVPALAHHFGTASSSVTAGIGAFVMVVALAWAAVRSVQGLT